jgi:hypothetical protein
VDPARYPASRATDPLSSHRAAEEFEATGGRARHEAKIMAALVSTGRAMTAWEIARAATLESNVVVCRRMAALAKAGAVRVVDGRTCSVSRRRAVAWEAL